MWSLHDQALKFCGEKFPRFVRCGRAAHRSFDDGLAKVPFSSEHRREPALLRTVFGQDFARARTLIFPQAIEDVERLAAEFEHVLIKRQLERWQVEGVFAHALL